MSGFEPIAIVGQGCVLPGALSPDALTDLVFERKLAYGPVSRAELGVPAGSRNRQKFVSGRVRGFDALFDPSRPKIRSLEVTALDPVCTWPLHAALEAWEDAGKPRARRSATGVFVANLSYPSAGHVDYAEQVWRGEQPANHHAVLTSELPAFLISEALSAIGPSMALDAACASSLYALDFACRQLETGKIDCAVVAGVNATDNLILHIGFDALRAISPTGQSRPFVQGADGLVPSEGAVAVVLKRLRDLDAGDTVHGVIRGIGLSNDGRRKGLLAPSGAGQTDAMASAYARAGLQPTDIDYLECHATGTPVGDGVEVSASADFFGEVERLPAGSVKANTGHLITVAGLASVLKITGAFQRELLPPTPLAGPLLGAVGTSQLDIVTAPEAWAPRSETRRAAISNFGFGGNNAHLILEAHTPASRPARSRALPKARKLDDIVICGAALMAGNDRTSESVLRRLMNSPLQEDGPMQEIGTDAALARVPPNDLQNAEPQQIAILNVVNEALAGVTPCEAAATGVFTAMSCAADSAVWPVRERSDTGAEANLDAVAPKLDASMVLGAMANMTANRVTYARDFQGMGLAISAGSASGAAALETAAEMLRAERLSMAIVAAADFAAEPVRTQALRGMGLTTKTGDRAGALVLKRRKDAEAAGDTILGMLGDIKWGGKSASPALTALDTIYGAAPTASQVSDMAASCLLSVRSHRLEPDGAILDLKGKPGKKSAMGGPSADGPVSKVSWQPAAPRIMPDPMRPPPLIAWHAAGSRERLATLVHTGKPGGRGQHRIALLAASETGMEDLRRRTSAQLKRGEMPGGPGVHCGEGSPDGELAFVFTGSAAVYPRMARRLLMAFPDVARKLSCITQANGIAALLAKSSLSEFEQLCAGTLVSQAHSTLLLDVLGVKPDAALGLSLGESNALFAFGYWKDPGALLQEISDAAMYERHLGGEFETARQAWGPNVPSNWTNWRIQAPVDAVKRRVADFPGVEITIVYADTDCMIGGPADACRKFAAEFGPGAGVMMNQHLIVHARAMKPFEDTWRRLHTRKVHEGPTVRLYANAVHDAYMPDADSAADMLTRQAVDTVEFPPTVRKAWEDGVRTFVELGPRDTLSTAISGILAGKPFKSVAMDRIETSDLAQVAEVAALLFADGRAIDLKPLQAVLQAARRNVPPEPPKWNIMRKVPYSMPKLTKRGNPTGIPFEHPPALAPPKYARIAVKQVPATPPAPRPSPPCGDTSPISKVVCGNTRLKARAPFGPSWSRPAIEQASRGSMSEFFGPEFKRQDGFARQVRLPAPPLLLVDRISGISPPPGEETQGVVWTETDLANHGFIVHDGFVRPGPLIECGQADLTLIGWMGADFRNQDQRVYRLLGCEIMFHEGGLPHADDTLRFQIEITGHAELSGVRMFFFQYDCHASGRAAFSVRNGQAGFFTDEELAAGKGVIWDANTAEPPTAEPAPFAPERASKHRAFSAGQLNAYREGDAFACFGDGFEACAAHSNPPRLPSGKLELFDEVEAFDPAGGPWKRGYLRARALTPKDAWFYDGHFHNDPCMPGTLMAEAAVQALEFHAAALGLTISRDGYVFEPVPGHTAKFVCRGQVIPDADHEVTYEVFIDEVIDGDTPEIYASLLARSDGKKVFYCPRFGIRLRRHWRERKQPVVPRLIGPMKESHGDEETLLECADGAPSAAFGEMYRKFDSESIVARLPQPPYHFLTRVTSVSTRPGTGESGGVMTAEYDIPEDAWFFDENCNGQMPFAVLAEIALQPCGWLASHSGFALPGGLRFRNLEGDGTLHREVIRTDRRLNIRSKLTNLSKAGPMTLVSFDVIVETAAGDRVLDLKTQFGFFPAAALARQAGLGPNKDYAAAFALPVQAGPDESHGLPMVSGKLRMVDRIDFYDPVGGAAGLGLIRGQQDIDPYAWYFKAHFYQDPVQPGSLGLDALTQILSRMVWLKGLAKGMKRPHLSTLATSAPIKWSYRGQVTPEMKQVTSVMEIQSIERRADDILITARGSLWRDGLRVYEVKPMCVSLRDLG
ncbi:MAG: hypothetical protein KDA53_10425 [Hyphomonas sp.]|nr:hypothetical protein [Hyphomonas sp.]